MTKRERQIVHDKYEGKCGYCGCNLEKGWHVDHIEPVGRINQFDHDKLKTVFTGKFDHPERNHAGNYMPSCASCNINKHGQSIEEFREMIAYFITTLNKNSTQYKIAKRYGLVKETGEKVTFFFETVVSGICDHCKRPGKLLEHSIWDNKNYHPECSEKMATAESN